MRQGSLIKTSAFYTILFILVMGILELLSLAVYRISFYESFSYKSLQSLRLALLDASQRQRDQNQELSTWVIHPYYGFVANPTLANSSEFGFSMPINEFGFFGSEDQIQKGDPEKLVVAVIGGSVAAAFGFHASAALKTALQNVPAFQRKNIVVLDLGNGAFKEPQGVIIINDIISRGGHIDLLIALDGFNEIALPEAHGYVTHRISPTYPNSWPALVDSHLSREQMNYLGKAGLAKDARLWFASTFSNSILSYSVTANLIWRVADVKLAATDAKYRGLAQDAPPANPESRLSTDGRGFLGPVVEYGTRRDLYKDIALNWARSSILLNNIMMDQGGLFMQFLQPNQYVVGSKPMSEGEEKLAISTKSPYRSPVETGYPYLQVVGQSLAASGIWFEDLTGMFAQTTQQIYSDNCCHFNQQGYDMLASAIGAAIAKRMSNPAGGRTVAIDHVALDDSIFAVAELRKFVASSPAYRDGAEEPLSRTFARELQVRPAY
jgi:hypothetical protein